MEKYGVKLNDAILAEEKHMPLYEELVKDYEVEYIAGGATQNTIRVAQWMLQSPPFATSYVGCVGKDEFGETLEAAATKDNVKVHYMKTEEESTGSCAVLVQDAERSLVTKLCAANKYSIDHLKQADTQELIAKAQIYYIAGFFLTVSVESALEVAKHSADNGKTFSMNLSAPFICQFFKDQLAQMMPHIDILFGNESEAEAYGESMGYETKDVAEIAALAAKEPYTGKKAGGRMVVITQGKDATIIATTEGTTVFDVPLVAKEEIIDSNGAGDSFVGGFLSELVKGSEISRAVEAGHYAAGVIIRHSGCTFPAKPSFE